MSDQIDTFEFIEGQKACRDGCLCPEDASESFQRGYGAEYERQEVMSNVIDR